MNKRTSSLRFFDLVIIVVSLVIGTGIFSNPTKVAATSPSEWFFYGIWILGGAMALAGALVFAELGILVPEPGAYYKIFAKAYHPSVGFSINTLIILCNAASLTIVALIGAEYCAHLFGLSDKSGNFELLFSIGCISLFVLVNLFGLRTSSHILNLLLLLKIVLILVLISTLFSSGNSDMLAASGSTIPAEETTRSPFQLFLVSLIPVCFTYGGYQQTINFSGEVGNGLRVKKGILLGVIMVIVLYLVLNAAYVHVIGFQELKKSSAIGATLFGVWFGDIGAKFFDGLIIFSVLAYTNILLMSNPLVMLAMAQDGLLPKFFSIQHSKTRALPYGLLSFFIIAILILLCGKNIGSIMGFTMFLDSIGMIASVSTLFILRKKLNAQVSNGYQKLISLLAIFFMLFYSLVVWGVVVMDVKAATIGASLFIFVWGLWFLLFRKMP